MPVGDSPVKISRGDISLSFPDDTRINLPDQKTLTGSLLNVRRVLGVGEASRDAARGDLFFENPKGKWESGTYTLEIKNKGINVKIPISLGVVE